MKRAGIDRSAAFVTNAMVCRPKDSPPKPKAINACRERLLEQVFAHPRKVVLAFGNSAMRAITGDHSFKMTSQRGLAIDLEEMGMLLPTFHPASVLRNKGEWGRWLEDIKYAGALLQDGVSAKKSPGRSRTTILLAGPEVWHGGVTDGQHLPTWPEVVSIDHAAMDDRGRYEKWFHKLMRIPELSLDIETGDSFSPRLGRILCLAVSYEPNKSVVISEETIRLYRPLVKKLLERHPGKLIWHNGKYDSEWFWNRGIKARVDEDTMLMHYCLDETKGTHGLKDLAQHFLGAQDYKKVVKKYTKKGDQGFERVPREVLYPYGAMDTDNTLQLYRLFAPKLAKSKASTRLYRKLLMPASNFIQQVERHGVWVDQLFIDDLEHEFTQQMLKAKKDLDRVLVDLWDKDEYMESKWATKKIPNGFNPGNYRHVRFILEEKLGLDPVNTTESALRNIDYGVDIAFRNYKTSNFATRGVDRRLEIKSPFIKALIDYRRAKKAMTAHVVGMRNRLEPDGRVHPTFNLHTTETGRLSSTNPNFQNLPTPEKEESFPIRNIVAAPNGRKLIELDYSQIELRLLAHFSRDEFLERVYREGRDLHTEVAVAIYGKDYTEYQRVRAKALNFGIAYGRGADSLSLEYKIPIEEAREIRRKWFDNAKQATEFLKHCHEMPAKGVTMTSVFGRRRRFGVVTRENLNNLQNEAANFPMQSTASDLTLLSAMKMQRLWDKEHTPAHVVCLVHDAVLVEADDAVVEQVKAEAKEIMEAVPVKYLVPTIPFPVDIHVNQRWGDMKRKAGSRRQEVGAGTRRAMLIKSDRERRRKGLKVTFQKHEDR